MTRGSPAKMTARTKKPLAPGAQRGERVSSKRCLSSTNISRTYDGPHFPQDGQANELHMLHQEVIPVCHEDQRPPFYDTNAVQQWASQSASFQEPQNGLQSYGQEMSHPGGCSTMAEQNAGYSHFSEAQMREAVMQSALHPLTGNDFTPQGSLETNHQGLSGSEFHDDIAFTLAQDAQYHQNVPFQEQQYTQAPCFDSIPSSYGSVSAEDFQPSNMVVGLSNPFSCPADGSQWQSANNENAQDQSCLSRPQYACHSDSMDSPLSTFGPSMASSFSQNSYLELQPNTPVSQEGNWSAENNSTLAEDEESFYPSFNIGDAVLSSVPLPENQDGMRFAIASLHSLFAANSFGSTVTPARPCQRPSLSGIEQWAPYGVSEEDSLNAANSYPNGQRRASRGESSNARSHEWYSRGPGKDGLYHCPDPNCTKELGKLKCNYE